MIRQSYKGICFPSEGLQRLAESSFKDGLLQLSNLVYIYSCKFRDRSCIHTLSLHRASHRSDAFCSTLRSALRSALRSSFCSTLRSALRDTFLQSFQLCRVEHILKIPVDLQAVLVILTLLGSVPGYLCLLKEAGEDTFLQSGRTLHQPREIVQDK